MQAPTRDELFDLYVTQQLGTVRIGEIYGKCDVTIGKWLRKNGIEVRRPGYDPIFIPGLSEMYKEMSVREIAAKTGFSHGTISRNMKRQGVATIPGKGCGRPDPVDSFFLEDSRELYYVVGFVSADGNIGTGLTGVTAAQTELEILEDMGALIGRTPTVLRKDGTYILSLGGKLLAKHFGDRWGIFPNKSKTIRLQGVPDEYFGDWLRGYFDGNGCVLNVRKDGVFTGAHIGITSGSVGLLEDIRGRLSSLGAGWHKIAMNDRGWGTSYSIKYGKADSERIYHLMYDGASLFLKRKKDKFGALREQYPLGGKIHPLTSLQPGV